jgi:CarboxypepD_reg-like domain
MKKTLFTTTALLFNLIAFSQTTIKGTVTSSKAETIIGANVVLEGTYDGASTDTLGKFQFSTVEKGEKRLIITFIGCDTLKMALILRGGETIELPLKIKEAYNEFNEVTISAGVFEASDVKKSVVLKSVDIAMTAGASADITGAMLTLPGTTRNTETGQLLVRGGAAYETRTIIDGMYVQNPYNSSTANLPARNRFTPFMFKGTMFSSRGYSAEYGQAMSSALILNTKDVEGQNTTGIQIMSVGGGLSQQKIWKNSSLSGSATYNNLSPYFKLMKQKFDFQHAPESGNADIFFKTKTSETGIFKIYATTSTNGFTINTPISTDENVKIPLILRGQNVYINTSFKEVVFKDWILFVGGAYTWNKDKIHQNFDLNTTEQSTQTRFTLTHHFSDNVKLKIGSEYLYNNFNEKYAENQVFTTKHIENYAAAFAETDLTITSKWLARVGVRAENSTLLGKANIAPRFSTAYILSKGEQVAFSFGQFYQTPEHTVMRRTTALDFEKANHYIATYEKIGHGYVFRMEGYYKTYHNLVKTVGTLSNNAGYGYARGLDIFFKDSKTIKNGDYYLSYSYLDTKRDYRNFPTLATPIFAPKHNFNAVYKHWLNSLHTMIGTTYSFQSGRPYNDPNTTDFNGGRTATYHDLSFNMAYITNIKSNFTVVYASVSNILGFNQVSGYRFSSRPDSDGHFQRSAITPPAKRFVVVGLLITIGQKFVKNRENNDDL